jgi:hypothetical protein
MEHFANEVLANNTVVRQQMRIAKVQALRASKNAARRHAAQQQAFMLQVNEVAAAHGVPAAQVQQLLGLLNGKPLPRANSATHKPSGELIAVNTGSGVQYLRPCKAVHALCATLPANATNKQMVQLATDHGINAATAATQVAIYRKAAAEQAARDAKQQH